MKLTKVGNGFYGVSQAFIDSNPTLEQVAQELCNVANYHVLEVDDTYAWGLAEQVGLKKSDFFDDKAETIAKHGLEAVDVYGIVNWKYKG